MSDAIHQQFFTFSHRPARRLRACLPQPASALLPFNPTHEGMLRPLSRSLPIPPLRFHIDARKTLEYLASDELEGRGVGTAGLDKAADLIATDFKAMGLTALPGYNNYFQPFKMTTSVAPDPKTALSSGDAEYKLGKDFTPIAFSNEGAFEGDVIFLGYGISSKKFAYDDYAGLDVKGKVVMAMRFEPHNEAGTSRFVKDDWSEEAHLIHKAEVAAQHGAAALILINPPSFHPGDMLMPFSRMGGERASLPVVQIRQTVADAWLKQANAKDLKSLQADIDKEGKPASIKLEGVKVKGDIAIRREEKEVKNVMAMLPGKGEHADEYLVVGSHYDHLGWGGAGSLAPGMRAIHHGADDNASGTVAMLKLADHFAHAGPPQKTLIFVAFTAEEEGLIGSSYFVNHPPVPLAKITAMLNLDMVGRVRNNVISVGGAGTAPSFDAFLKEANVDSPLVQKSFGRGGMGPSDHMSFALKKVPVLFLFSGMHMDYHRPTDTADKVNYDGLQEVVNFSIKLLAGLQDMPRETYVDAADKDSMSPTMTHGGARVTLGIVPDYSTMDDASKGVKISGTSAGSPAEKAGLKEGDTIVQWNTNQVDSLQQLTNLLAAGKAGDKVKLGVLREGKRLDLEATLAERKS